MISNSPDNAIQRDLFSLVVIVFLSIYLPLTIAIGWLLIDWQNWTGFVFFVSFELLFIGIAYDFTESLMATFVSPQKTPQLKHLSFYPPVALVMTVCDDIKDTNQNHWAMLQQTYPNCNVYILDDSQSTDQKALVDQSGWNVVRREGKRSYKAGNINHWLALYGEKYKYLVILDSDSLIPVDYVTRLVLYAEHPDNQFIAIFQSRILPTGTSTLFSRTLGSMAKVRFFILERFANRAGLILSWGHNQLLRMDALRKIGGFYEDISPEDTSLSLMLSATGYSARLVQVDSHDTDPENIISFIRRTARWAGQTAELFSLPWIGTSLRLKILLCFHLYNYTVHNIYLFALILAAWCYDSREISPLELLKYSVTNTDKIWHWVLVLAGLTSLWLAQLALRLFISIRAGVTAKDFFKHMLLASALYSFAGLSVNKSVFRVLAGNNVKFIPTNSKTVEPSLQNLVPEVSFWLIIGLLISLGMLMRNRLLFFSLNGLWLLFWLITPLTLWFFHRDQLVKEG
jgi:membrane glycosyltransferase